MGELGEEALLEWGRNDNRVSEGCRRGQLAMSCGVGGGLENTADPETQPSFLITTSRV